jgi:hypothetical protein
MNATGYTTDEMTSGSKQAARAIHATATELAKGLARAVAARYGIPAHKVAQHPAFRALMQDVMGDVVDDVARTTGEDRGMLVAAFGAAVARAI